MRHPYGEHPDQFGELTLPPAPPEEGPFPVAVLVHGGGWEASYDLTLMSGLAADLARRGWAAWNLEFRRVGPASRGGWPQTGDDVLAGIDALAGLAAGGAPLDLEAVVVIGHSSGGQLALWAASQRRGLDAPVQIRAAVSQAGVVHLARHRTPRVTAFLGGSYDEVPERYEAASPSSLLPLRVPVLVVQGGADATVPAAMSERFCERASAAGDRVTLVLLPGAGHIEHLDPGAEAWEVVVRWLEPWGP